MLENILTEDAAAMLKKSPQFVRIGLQRNLLPFGSAVQMSSMYTYHISPQLFSDYSGRSLESIERFVEKQNKVREARKVS